MNTITARPDKNKKTIEKKEMKNEKTNAREER